MFSSQCLITEMMTWYVLCLCDSNMACSVAGITSDANVLTNYLRQFSQRHLLHYGESIPCEQLVASLCDIKQAYTQFGGLSFLCVTLND